MINEILTAALLSITSLVVLFLLTKLMGRKQMSELSIFDYIIGISIGSIAAEMATNLEDYHKPLTAMIIYSLFALTLSVVDYKSFTAQKLIVGKPMILYEDGKIYNKNLHIAKLSIDDLLSQCRSNGYFNLGSLKLIILESNGNMSFLPLSAETPPTAAAMNIIPPQVSMPVNVIINGKVISKNLADTGNDRTWLQNQLNLQNVKSISEVTLATCDAENNLSVYSKT
ncbi:MAG: hypothetical protein BWY46_00626 [Firmicutes bacterium ADurb.Bin300]|jgi:uncharacterized membrane protein YcaP (DUF421 family)|nr:MAG: hypothetical protein BWY46_00626 [Firmicutes bacterium ADurb.Bin300]HOD02173.1 DUF421 domain-containing protein [Clostridiales bacterium]